MELDIETAENGKVAIVTIQSENLDAGNVKKFQENIKKTRTVVKAEMAAGVDVTPAMDGGVLLRIITKKNSCSSCCKDPTRDCDTEH